MPARAPAWVVRVSGFSGWVLEGRWEEADVEGLAYDQGPGEGAVGLECAGHGRCLLSEGIITQSGRLWLPIWKSRVERALFTPQYKDWGQTEKGRDTKCVI